MPAFTVSGLKHELRHYSVMHVSSHVAQCGFGDDGQEGIGPEMKSALGSLMPIDCRVCDGYLLLVVLPTSFEE